MSQNAPDNSSQPDAIPVPPTPQGSVPLEYTSASEPVPGTATASLVLGILSMALGLLAAVPAIFCARSAMRKIKAGQTRGWGRAKAGMVLGIIGTVWGMVQIVLLVTGFVSAYREFMRMDCEMNMRTLARVIYIYAQDHEDLAPPSMDRELIRSATSIPIDRVFFCPWSGRANYVYLPPAGKMGDTPNAAIASTVLVYEPVSNHGDGAAFLLGDGHAEYIQSPLADQVIKELGSGANPPPALLARTAAPLIRAGSSGSGGAAPATIPAISATTQIQKH
jgi:hypothetical protein